MKTKGILQVYKADIFDIAKNMDHEPVAVEIELTENGQYIVRGVM